MELRSDLNDVEDQMAEVMDRLSNVVYDEIYRQAKKSIFIVDNYIGLKTLEKLINIQDGVDVSIFSDNLAKGLRKNTYIDFCKEYPNLNIQLFHSGGIFHDRYIVLDYGTDDEKIEVRM